MHLLGRLLPLGDEVVTLLTPAETAEAKSPERINPQQVLSAEGVRVYNSLTLDVRLIIRDETVPQLLAEVKAGPLKGVAGDLYDAEVRALVEFVVATAKKAQDALEQAIANPGVQPMSHGLSECSYKTSMGSSSLVVYVGHVAKCDATMETMTAGGWLLGPGYWSGWINNAYYNTKSALFFKGSGYNPGTCWLGWGDGSAIAMPGGPSPIPGSGEGAADHCP